MNLRSFSRKIRVRAKGIPRDVNSVMRKVALVADQALVVRTPVDTGRARSNWLVSLGSSRSDVIAPYAPSSRAGISESANANAAISQGKAVISRRQPGQTIYISNNVPYIRTLNNGSSAQAPAMFVQIAVSQAVGALRNVKFWSRRGLK